MCIFMITCTFMTICVPICNYSCAHKVCALIEIKIFKLNLDVESKHYLTILSTYEGILKTSHYFQQNKRGHS